MFVGAEVIFTGATGAEVLLVGAGVGAAVGCCGNASEHTTGNTIL